MDLQSLEIVTARSENLPVLPQVVSVVLRLIDDPTSSSRALEAALEKDPAIVAKLLRSAGSAFYGGTPPGTISRAIAMLGMSTIRSLVVGIAFQQVIGPKTSNGIFDRIEFWKHSVAVASASRVIGKVLNNPQAEQFYFAGLVHDVGLLVLDRFAADALEEAITRAKADGSTLIEAEHRVNKITHADVGGILARRWSLNELQSKAIRYHHAPEEEDTGLSIPTAIVSIADTIAHRAGFKNQASNAPDPEPDELILEFLGLPVEQLEPIQGAVAKEVDRMTQSFGVAA